MKKLLPLTLLLLPMSLLARDIIVIETRITGSQEQPRVISVVPWQQPELSRFFEEDMTGLGLNFDSFQPIEREAFNRELRYISATRK